MVSAVDHNVLVLHSELTRSPHIVLLPHVLIVKRMFAKNLKVSVFRISRKNFIDDR